MKKDLHLTLTRDMFLLGLAVCGAGSLIAAPGDGHWDRQFGLPGVTNRVFALRFNGDKLYAGGYGVGTGGLLSTNTSVDIFDGTNWSNAIGELTGGTCVIYEVGFLRGDIYVGGIFSRAGGVSSPYDSATRRNVSSAVAASPCRRAITARESWSRGSVAP